MADQMRPLSHQACLSANRAGTFKLAVLDSEVVGDATWTGLERPHVQGTSLRSLLTCRRRGTTIGPKRNAAGLF